MTYEQNVKAILESNFAGFKEEIIDIACKRICMLEDKTERLYRVHWRPEKVFKTQAERDAYIYGYGDGHEDGYSDGMAHTLEIIYKTRLEQDVKASWAYKRGWNDSLDVVVAVLKGGEQE